MERGVIAAQRARLLAQVGEGRRVVTIGDEPAAAADDAAAGGGAPATGGGPGDATATLDAAAGGATATFDATEGGPDVAILSTPAGVAPRQVTAAAAALERHVAAGSRVALVLAGAAEDAGALAATAHDEALRAAAAVPGLALGCQFAASGALLRLAPGDAAPPPAVELPEPEGEELDYAVAYVLHANIDADVADTAMLAVAAAPLRELRRLRAAVDDLEAANVRLGRGHASVLDSAAGSLLGRAEQLEHERDRWHAEADRLAAALAQARADADRFHDLRQRRAVRAALALARITPRKWRQRR